MRRACLETPPADLLGSSGEQRGQQRGREIREKRSTDFKSIRKPDKIFYGERCFNGPYGPRLKQALSDHRWFVVTVDDRDLIDWPLCPSSAETVPPVSTGDCDIASNVAETRKFRNFWSPPGESWYPTRGCRGSGGFTLAAFERLTKRCYLLRGVL